MKKKLLFLVHRLPYPPNKGDKIASFNLLRFLAQRYEVFVGTFIDDPDDRQYLDKVHEYCSALCAPEIRPGLARIASLRGLLTGEALSLPYLRNRELQRWTTDVLRDEHPERIVIFSGPMAQYVSGRVPANAVTLFDMVDVDSEKWRSYGERKRWPMSWLYRREADRLLAFERRMAAEFDSTVFVSREEAELFRGLAPESAAKTTYRIQGVDSEFFDPSTDFANPYPGGARALVFTGMMDYWPNVDAVTWFAGQVLPRIRAGIPDVLFCIVGMRPAPEVSRLGETPGDHGHRGRTRCPPLPRTRARGGAAAAHRARHPEQGPRGNGHAAAGDRHPGGHDRDPAFPRFRTDRQRGCRHPGRCGGAAARPSQGDRPCRA